MDEFYVYMYRDESGTPIYVGKGKDRRAWMHLNSKKKHPFTNKLQKMIREGNDPQPEFICKDVDEEFAFFCEEEAIRKFGRKDLGTGTLLNLTDGGEGVSGYKMSPEILKKMSEFQKGKILSEEHKKKISEARKGIKRGPHSEEARKRMSEAQRERGSNRGPHSEEHKKKISESLKGKPPSEETRKKISETLKRRLTQNKIGETTWPSI